MAAEQNDGQGQGRTTQHGLDPDSYTAQRLHHSSPEHLHLTTRTCFVGPIPDGWLKSHRKQWYTHHLHINYHYGGATFSARHGVNRIRQLTGLEGPSSSAMFRGSFPQPDDVEEEQEDGEGGEEEAQVATDADPPAMAVPRSTDDRDAAPAEADRDSDDAEAGPSSPKQADNREELSTSKTGSSFHTANETFGGGDSEADGVPRSKAQRQTSKVGDGQKGDAAGNRLGSVSEEPSERSDSMVSDGSALPQASRVNSRSPLLTIEDKATEETGKGAQQAESSSCSGPTASQATDPGQSTANTAAEAPPSAEPDAATKAHPAAAGLVRFNLPDGDAEEERRTTIRQAQIRRRQSLRRAHRGNKHDGEIVKAEKMLVKIETTTQELPEDYDENASMGVDTKPAKKWQEYVSVIREVADQEEGFVLQLYRTREIPADPKRYKRSRPSYDIPLNRRLTRVNLYSSLDKTVVVSKTTDRGSMIFILRPRSFASSVEWYTFLRHVLGWGWIRELQINVPDLSLALYLENPFQQLEAERSAAQGADVIDDAAILKTMQEENAVAGNIIRRCVEMLEANSEWKDVLQKWSATNKMGLAWRRYDRLEWVHGAHEQKMYGTVGMQRTHELELRPMGHYPTTVTPHSRRLVQAASNDGQTGRQQEPSNTTSNPLHHHHHHHDNPTLTEPSAVEGFLIRLTSQRGRASQFGRMFYKRLYFSTHDQYLCFSMPANAIPPPPPRLPMTEQSTVPTPQQIRENMPLIYAVVPFRLDDGEIAWLRSGDAATRKLHDQDAYDEAERRVNTLLRADGFVDLCKVVKVRPVVRGSVPADENVEEGDGADFNEDVADTTREDGNVSSFDDNRTFELVLTNGLIVRLEAYNAEAQREWIVRLGALVKYWKLRKTADLEILNSVRQTNLAQLNIAEQSESYVGQFAEKWELSQALASPEMFNMCGISCCRTVSMSGLLYWKPRRRSTFRKCSVILCHGQLLLFEASLRSRMGAEIAYSHLGRLSAIDLRDCYVYSGLVTEGDLLYQNSAAASSSNFSFVDSSHPGRHVLPRVYLEDGITTGGVPDAGSGSKSGGRGGGSGGGAARPAGPAGPWMSSSDDDTMTCFVIWRALRKSYFKVDDGTVNGSMPAGSGVTSSGIGDPNTTTSTAHPGPADGRGTEDAGHGRKRKQLRQVTSLGVPGRSIVFKTRSRSERDRWVMSIATEIERLQPGEEIRIV